MLSLQSWTSEIKNQDSFLGSREHGGGDENLPPVRGHGNTHLVSNSQTAQPQPVKQTKRAAPRDYKEWDKWVRTGLALQ